MFLLSLEPFWSENDTYREYAVVKASLQLSFMINGYSLPASYLLALSKESST